MGQFLRFSVKVFLLIMIASVIAFSINSSVCFAKYERSNWRAVSNGLYYKWLPSNWWLAYYLKEFDKVASPPGADWDKGRSDVATWIDAAREKGWVIETRVSAAKVGAIAIRYNFEQRKAQFNLVREVYEWGFISNYIGQDGEPTKRKLLYIDLLSNKDGYTFRGYILPERVKNK